MFPNVQCNTIGDQSSTSNLEARSGRTKQTLNSQNEVLKKLTILHYSLMTFVFLKGRYFWSKINSLVFLYLGHFACSKTSSASWVETVYYLNKAIIPSSPWSCKALNKENKRKDELKWVFILVGFI